jgi:hypothetical protein
MFLDTFGEDSCEITQNRLIIIYRRRGETCQFTCSSLNALKTEAASSSETLVNNYPSTRRHILEDLNAL